MSKLIILSVFIITCLLFINNVYPVVAGYIVSNTEQEAIRQGWLKQKNPNCRTSQSKDGNLYPTDCGDKYSCLVRSPSNDEVNSLLVYCQSYEKGWPISSDQCEQHIQSFQITRYRCDNPSFPYERPLKVNLQSTTTKIPTFTPIPSIANPTVIVSTKLFLYSNKNKKIGDMTINELTEVIKKIIFKYLNVK